MECSVCVEVMKNLSDCCRMQGQLEKATPLAKNALEMAVSLLPPGHADLGWCKSIYASVFVTTISTLTTCCLDHISVAACYLESHQLDLSLESYKRAAEIFKKCLRSEADGLAEGAIR